ncbi:MAG: hypothetical protein LQ351_002504 [Letrouitia transgressa]|nr:MAG: hypothetical protein LQ351_002504 [Letrouitia transgressa]
MTAICRLAPIIDAPTTGEKRIGGNHNLDEAVIAALPPKLKLISAERYGDSARSATASITAQAEDGTEANSKACKRSARRYPVLPLISTALEDLKETPSPIYFFLCEFVNITNNLPDPKVLAAQLALMHHKSQSPTGKFGFPVTTYDGKLPQTTDWESSWTTFFSKLFAGIARLDTDVNGLWDELHQALDRTLNEVVPRLLNALEENDLQTGNLYIFDAASYYAHNEMELGIWRTDHHRMKSKAYKIEYLRNFEASEPVDEWDDRNRLYSIKTQLMYSAHVPGSRVRNAAFENLKYLIQKYGSRLENV